MFISIRLPELSQRDYFEYFPGLRWIAQRLFLHLYQNNKLFADRTNTFYKNFCQAHIW